MANNDLVEKYSRHSAEGKRFRRKFKRRKAFHLIMLFIAFGLVIKLIAFGSTSISGHRQYSMAPHPKDYPGAVIQVYSARTWGSKGILAVHTWIALKREGQNHYTISEIVGWRLRRGGTALVTSQGAPDKDWWGKAPTKLLDIRGESAATLIDKVEVAINTYPWANEYTVWPGPNSNTFTSWIGLQVPELGLDLPSTAIGKDWRPINDAFGFSASGTGLQASLYGLLGTSIGFEEGVEINLLGLNLEVDLFDLALELPAIGRIGFDEVNQ